MKVQCDICDGAEAAVLCCADEAALCAACDSSIHRANKLAGKHNRLSLVPSSAAAGGGCGGGLSSSAPPAPPKCDVCQEQRGMVFCVEDRAILCCECEESIHNANERTMRHSRYLLTGVRVGSAPALTPADKDPSPPEETPAASAVTGSSISDYVTKVCPGWRVEDLLVDDAAVAAAVASQKEQQLPFLDAEIDVFALAVHPPPAPPELGRWAPHVPQAAPLQPAWPPPAVTTPLNVFDDMFAVPQISPVGPNPNKRQRPSPSPSTLWY